MGSLRIVIAIVVTVVWATAYLAPYFGDAGTPPPELSGVMVGVVAWALGSETKRRLARVRDALREEEKNGES